MRRQWSVVAAVTLIALQSACSEPMSPPMPHRQITTQRGTSETMRFSLTSSKQFKLPAVHWQLSSTRILMLDVPSATSFETPHGVPIGLHSKN